MKKGVLVMISRVNKKGSAIVTATAVMLVVALPCTVLARIEGDLELLRLVANGYKANFEKIETWQGKASIDFERLPNGAVSDTNFKNIKRRNSVEFLYDADRDAARWYWNKLEGKVTGGKSQTEEPYFASGMVKKQQLYTLFPVSPTSPRPPGNVSIMPKSSYRGHLGWNGKFHPAYYFQCVERDWHKRLIFYYENADHPDMSRGKVERKGNIVTFEVISRTSGAINYHEFDLSKGGCLVKYLAKDSIITETWDFEYEQVDDVFVPKKVTHENIDSNKSRTSKRIVVFTQNILNKPIDPREFELDKLQLQSGDKVQDWVTGIKWRYGLPELPDFVNFEVIDTLAIPPAQEKQQIREDIGQSNNVEPDIGLANANIKKTNVSTEKTYQKFEPVPFQDNLVANKGTNKKLWLILAVVLIMAVTVVTRIYRKCKHVSINGRNNDE